MIHAGDETTNDWDHRRSLSTILGGGINGNDSYFFYFFADGMRCGESGILIDVIGYIYIYPYANILTAFINHQYELAPSSSCMWAPKNVVLKGSTGI